MKIVVTGVKASGKTTTVQFIKKSNPDIKILTVGDFFERIFKETYGKNVKRELTEEISRSDTLKLTLIVAKQLVEETKGFRNVIIDSNLLFVKPTGFFPGFNRDFLDILNPDVIVVMEVHPQSILERRVKDEKRTVEEVTEIGTIARHRTRHAAQTIDGIKTEQEIQRVFALNCASIIGCSVKIINLLFKEREPYEHTRIASEEIMKILKSQG